MIGPQEERFLRNFLPNQAERNGAKVIAMGIVSDHVHLLLRLEPVLSVPKMVQSLKGASSRVSKRSDKGGRGLRWAKGYDLRSVSPRNVEAAIKYVLTQAARHPDRAILTAEGDA
jgi:REP element-mobilizing transposase RayT